MVTGAPGAGKSTVIPELLRLRHGQLVVMDMDELLDHDGRVLGIDIADSSAAANWPAYNALWLRITELVRRSGSPMLLLTPAVPKELPEGRWLHLDCPDAVRRKRLANAWLVRGADRRRDRGRGRDPHARPPLGPRQRHPRGVRPPHPCLGQRVSHPPASFTERNQFRRTAV